MSSIISGNIASSLANELQQTMLDELETSCRDTQEARARKLPTEGPEGKEQAEVAAGEKH